MKNFREEWYDEEAKVAITIADATAAAQALARGHLCGPTSAFFLSRALAAVSLLGAEMSEEDEVVSLQMKCSGPLGGVNVECTAAGTLRGYPEKKVLDDFDGLGRPDAAKVLGDKRIQVTRSVPGRIISQGLSTTLGGYLTQSLQRTAEIRVDAEVTDDVEVVRAVGVMVEALPDSPVAKSESLIPARLNLAASSRNILAKLGHPKAVLKKKTPLEFACRCSAERAAAMLDALGPDERAALPPSIDITCHMCGRVWSVKVGSQQLAVSSPKA